MRKIKVVMITSYFDRNGVTSQVMNYATNLDKDRFQVFIAAGEPYDIDNEPQKPMSWIWIPISLVAGIVLSLIVVGTMKSKLKTVRFQAAANNYVKAGSMNLTESRDIFLYNTMTKTKKEKNDSHSGGGGSSTHTTSSGSTAGGGGGKF